MSTGHGTNGQHAAHDDARMHVAEGGAPPSARPSRTRSRPSSASAAAPAAAAAPSQSLAHVGSLLPFLPPSSIQPAPNTPPAADLTAVRDAHRSLQRCLRLLDDSLRDAATPSEAHMQLYLQLVDTFDASLVATHGRHFQVQQRNLALYWQELLCSILTRRWWPLLLDRLPQPLPNSHLEHLQLCAKRMPLQEQQRAFTQAMLTVSRVPAHVLTAYSGVRQLAVQLSDVDNTDVAGGKDAMLQWERDLLTLSCTALRTLLHAPFPRVSTAVRAAALLPDRMLEAVGELVYACAQTHVMQQELGPGIQLRDQFARVLGGAQQVAPANMMVASAANPAAWAQWKGIVATLRRLAGIPEPSTQPAVSEQPAQVSAPSASALQAPAKPPQLRNPAHAQPQGDLPSRIRRKERSNPDEIELDDQDEPMEQRGDDVATSASVAAASAPTVPAALTPGSLSPAFVDRLTTELRAWYARRALSPRELEQRDALLAQLQLLVRAVDPSLKVDVFGSAASRTAMKGSDMDVALFTSTGKPLEVSKNGTRNLMVKLLNRLRNGPYKSVLPILGARVPIIKFTDRRSDIACDLSVGQFSTAYKSRLLRAYTQHDARVAELIAVVKHWASKHGLNDGSKGTLNSFGWSLMVIQYLQMLQPPVLPSLQAQSEAIRDEQHKAGLPDMLQPAEPQEGLMHVQAPGAPTTAASSSFASASDADADVPHSPFITASSLRPQHPNLPQFFTSTHDERVWLRADIDQMALAPPEPHPRSPPLGALFVGFLHFYSHVFQAPSMVVNIRAGSVSPRSHWAGAYKFANGAGSPLAIADPFDLTDNVARAIKGDVWSWIRREMADALRQLQQNKTYAQIAGGGGDEQHQQHQQHAQQHAQQQQWRRSVPHARAHSPHASHQQPLPPTQPPHPDLLAVFDPPAAAAASKAPSSARAPAQRPPSAAKSSRKKQQQAQQQRAHTDVAGQPVARPQSAAAPAHVAHAPSAPVPAA